MITEDQLEQICLEWFHEGGYEYALGPDIFPDGETPMARDGLVPGEPGMAEAQPERVDYRQIVLASLLLSAMQKINPPYSISGSGRGSLCRHQAGISGVVPQQPHLSMFAPGRVPVEYSIGDEIRHNHAKLIDSLLRNTLLPKLLSGELATKLHKEAV